MMANDDQSTPWYEVMNPEATKVIMKIVDDPQEDQWQD
jgi:hypothetical protein